MNKKTTRKKEIVWTEIVLRIFHFPIKNNKQYKKVGKICKKCKKEKSMINTTWYISFQETELYQVLQEQIWNLQKIKICIEAKNSWLDVGQE